VSVGHADAAVHLHISLETRWEGVADLRLGERDQLGGARGNRLSMAVKAASTHERANSRSVNIFGRPVLQGLEGADHLAELDPVS